MISPFPNTNEVSLRLFSTAALSLLLATAREFVVFWRGYFLFVWFSRRDLCSFFPFPLPFKGTGDSFIPPNYPLFFFALKPRRHSLVIQNRLGLAAPSRRRFRRCPPPPLQNSIVPSSNFFCCGSFWKLLTNFFFFFFFWTF